MKYILIAIVFFFSSFNTEYENKWVCHSILDAPLKQTCIVKIIEATSRDEAELKFDIYIEEKEKEFGAKQRDKSAYAVEPLKKSITKEHELKAFLP